MRIRILKPISFKNTDDITRILAILTSKVNEEHRKLKDEEIIDIFSQNLIYTTRGTFLLDDILDCNNEAETFLTAPGVVTTLQWAKDNPKKLILNKPVAKCLYEIHQNRYSTFPFHFTAPRDPKTGLPILLPSLTLLGESYELNPEHHIKQPNETLKELISLRFGANEREQYNNEKLLIEIDERLKAYELLIKIHNDFYQLKLRELAYYKMFLKAYDDLKEMTRSEIQQLDEKTEKKITSLKNRQNVTIIAVFIATVLLTALALAAVIACPTFITIPALMYTTLILGPAVVLGSFLKIGGVILNRVNNHFEAKISEQKNIQERIKNYQETLPVEKTLTKLVIKLKTVIDYITECPNLLMQVRHYIAKQRGVPIKLSDNKATLNCKTQEIKTQVTSDPAHSHLTLSA